MAEPSNQERKPPPPDPYAQDAAEERERMATDYRWKPDEEEK